MRPVRDKTTSYRITQINTENAVLFDHFPPKADLLQRRMSLGLTPLAATIQPFAI
jgi:hypothetical protein